MSHPAQSEGVPRRKRELQFVAESVASYRRVHENVASVSIGTLATMRATAKKAERDRGRAREDAFWLQARYAEDWPATIAKRAPQGSACLARLLASLLGH